MKIVGTLMLIVGVGLSASYGSRLSPEMLERSRLQGSASFGPAAAKDLYCEARTEADLPYNEDCPDPNPAPTQEPAEADAEEGEATEGEANPVQKRREEMQRAARERQAEDRPTFEAALAEKRAAVAARREAVVEPAVSEAYERWVDAMDAAAEPAARLASMPEPEPGARVSAWASESGAMFGVGLLILMIGAVVFRVAAKKEALGEGATKGSDAPQDFGALLSSLERDVAAITVDVAGVTAPTDADFERVQKQVEAIQLEKIEPLIDARGRVQAKYGMAGFAEVYGPLSAGERRLNRTWSALVDRHWPEARDSVEGASKNLSEAKSVFEGLTPN